MTKTTIQLSEDTKAKLDNRKLDGESYDDAVARILEDSGVLFDETEIRAIAREEATEAINSD